MFKKLVCLTSFVLGLGLVGDVQGSVGWTDAGLDHLWSTATNWSGDTLPAPSDDAEIGMLPGPIIVNEGAVADELLIKSGELTVEGGTLTTTRQIMMRGGGGTLNMNSGTINTSKFTVGHTGSATINMTGGTIITNQLIIGRTSSGTGHVNLDGGIITIKEDFNMRSNAGAVGTMDVAAGTLIIDGDNLSTVQEYIDNGWISAYDGNGTLQMDYDVTNEGKTTLKAAHMLNPNPADGDLASPGEMELSWTLPDPCMPGQPVLVDVYFTDDWEALYTFTNPEAIRIVSEQNVTSVVVQTQVKTRYYWAVDTYIGDPNDPIFGPIFSFFADNANAPPKVDAGRDIVTWLQEGFRTGNLDGTITITDDGAIQPYTLQWMVINEPNDPDNPDAVIADSTAEDTSIALSAPGEYVLQLEAFDGEYTVSDTVTINVYNNCCQATQSLPGYEPFPGDLNADCIVDDLDLAILQEDWLKDNLLTEEWFKVD